MRKLGWMCLLGLLLPWGSECAAAPADSVGRAATYPPPVLSEGSLYQGMIRAIPRGRVIAPYGLEVTYEKTVHLIFPSAIRYVDLGSPSLMAAKADGGVENVLRVRAAVEGFERETNLGVICDDGSFYSFNVKYAREPEKLSVEMADFLGTGNGTIATNRQDIYFHELGSVAPAMVGLLMESILSRNARMIKHIAVREFGVTFSLRGVYSHEGLLYFHTMIRNGTAVDFQVDFISWRVVDREVLKRTAIQERVLEVVRTRDVPSVVKGHGSSRSIHVLENFSLPSDKRLEVTLYERGGNQALKFYVESSDLSHAESLAGVQLKL